MRSIGPNFPMLRAVATNLFSRNFCHFCISESSSGSRVFIESCKTSLSDEEVFLFRGHLRYFVPHRVGIIDFVVIQKCRGSVQIS
ncbi:unnamed protein product [Haemonchus placei]|uniref:Uncharacterized protein n=1 Tax=Haemonchus placei TaxID=6290 RepID=A0A3P8A3Q2_HAEPC|nr:unnamed protein product [Haemonchus placei]